MSAFNVVTSNKKKKMKTLDKNLLVVSFFVFVFCLQITSVQAQFENRRKNIDALLGEFYKKDFSLTRTKSAGFVDITKYLPKNYVVDGSVDYTTQIQKAFDDQKKIIMPNFPLQVKGIWVRSNSEVWFQPKSKLAMKPTSDTHYMVLALIGVENVSIYNADLEGEYSRHLGNAGAWGYGLDIRGSKNIKIYNCYIRNCWGDGIVISSNPNKFTKGLNLFETNNIVIENVVVDFNRRNGVTIAGGENIQIKNALISNTFGTQPKSGIDFEPDNGNHQLKNISLRDVTFFNNAFGLNFYLNSYAVHNKNKTLNIDANNLTFKDQITALVIYGFEKKPNKLPLLGQITINGVHLENVNNPIHKSMEDFKILPKFSISNWSANKGKINRNEMLKGVKNTRGLEVK